MTVTKLDTCFFTFKTGLIIGNISCYKDKFTFFLFETLEKYWHIPPTHKPTGFNQTDLKSLKMANKIHYEVKGLKKKKNKHQDTSQMLYLIHQHKNKQIDIKNRVPKRNIFQYTLKGNQFLAG